MTPNELQTAVEELEALSKTGNDYAQAETQARLLLAEESIANEPELHCKVLLALSSSLWRYGLSQEALPFAEQALFLAQTNQFKDPEAWALGTIGSIYGTLSDYQRALEYFGKSLAAHEELGNKSRAATAIKNIGVVYEHLSNYPYALEYYGKALAAHEELGEKSATAEIIGNIGNVYRDISDYSHALEYYTKALSALEELGDKSSTSRVISNIGSVYSHLSDYPRALEYHGKALTMSEELGDKHVVAVLTGQIGSVYSHLSEYTRALECHGKALAIFEEIGLKRYVANCLGSIAGVYFHLADYQNALEYVTKALAFYEEIGSKNGIATNLGNIGLVYSTEEFDGYDFTKAEEYLLKAFAMNEEIGAKKELYGNHKNLSDLYKRQERWEEFAIHLEKYHKLKEQVKSEEAKKKAEQLDYERKTAEREKQLAVERAEAATVKRILHNTLPPIIADRLINNETFIADSYPNVSVLFMDLVNFTRIAAIIPPRHLIYVLNTIFSNADAVMEKHGLEKIKTIGDAYMAVAGAPVHQDDHAQRAAQAAIDVMEAMNNLSVIIPEELGETSWTEQVGEIQVRIGLHCGEAIGGVIGDKKFTFDLWGDAVNTAARMEGHGEAGRIHVSEAFMRAATEHSRSEVVKTGHALSLHTATFSFSSRGEMEIKGKGTMRTYFLERV